MGPLLIINRLVDLQDAVRRIADLLAVGVRLLVLHHGNPKEGGLYTNWWRPVLTGPEGKQTWAYVYADPAETMAAVRDLQAAGIKCLHYVAPHAWGEACGPRAGMELLGYIGLYVLRGRFDGVYCDGTDITGKLDGFGRKDPYEYDVRDFHASILFWDQLRRGLSGKSLVLHDSLGALSGGRPNMFWSPQYDALVIGEQPFATGPQDPLLAYYRMFARLGIHPYYAGDKRTWERHSDAELLALLTAGYILYVHMHELNTLLRLMGTPAANPSRAREEVVP